MNCSVETFSDGSYRETYKNLEGKRHNAERPSVICYRADKTIHYQYWFFEDKLHNSNGPAEIYYNKDGSISCQYWYVDGNPVSFGE